MIYLFLIYLIFQAMFDHWAKDTVTSKVIYYVFQFGWVAALAFVQMLKGRYVEFYAAIALIMTIISLSFLSWINTDVTTFTMMTSGPPAFTLTIITVVLFLWLLYGKKLWNGLKKLGRSH